MQMLAAMEAEDPEGMEQMMNELMKDPAFAEVGLGSCMVLYQRFSAGSQQDLLTLRHSLVLSLLLEILETSAAGIRCEIRVVYVGRKKAPPCI